MVVLSLRFLCLNLVLVLLLFQPFVTCYAAAKTIIVVDVDGNTNNYAALTTILQHPRIADNLRLVTVSGATFGHASTVMQNICSFLSLAGRSSVPVAMGQVSALLDIYSTQTHIGNCARKQGFPATPRDASLRGMPYSKFDVSSAFGQAYQLPRNNTAGRNCSHTIDSATSSFLNLVQQSSAGDTIAYLQLGSSTNFAKILDAVESSNFSSALFYSVVQVHAVETGYSGGADAEASSKVLSASNLTLHLYPPVFYAPSIAFNNNTWSQFATIAQGASSSAIVKWLYEVLNAKKVLFELRGDSLMNFYNEVDLTSSLVTLCALDEAIGDVCKLYRNAASSISFNYTLPDSSDNYLVLSISGGNVTPPFYYGVQAAASGFATPDTANNRVLSCYNVSALVKIDGAASNLVDKFWEVWLNLLRS